MQIVSPKVEASLAGGSMIRKMFEAAIELRAKYGAENVHDFSLGNPDLPAPPSAANELRRLADIAAQPMTFGYCPNAGIPSVRAALAGLVSKEQATAVDAKHIVVTTGAAGGINAFFRAVLEPGDEVLCPAPYFVEYGAYAGNYGGVLKTVPMRAPDFDLDPDALIAAVTDRTRAIIINTPNNPTGAIYGADKLARLGALLADINNGRDKPVFLLSDEPYRTLCYDGETVPPVMPVSEFSVIIGSFSKSLALAGERIGYIAPNPAMPRVDTLVSAVTLTNRILGAVNAPVIGQRLVEAMIHETVNVGIYEQRRAAMAEILRDAGLAFAMPRGAFYFFVQAPGGDDLAFVNHLLTENILAVPGTGFGYPGYFRLAFCMDETTIRRAAPAFKRATASWGK